MSSLKEVVAVASRSATRAAARPPPVEEGGAPGASGSAPTGSGAGRTVSSVGACSGAGRGAADGARAGTDSGERPVVIGPPRDGAVGAYRTCARTACSATPEARQRARFAYLAHAARGSGSTILERCDPPGLAPWNDIGHHPVGW